jgi:ketosteroid isomerase-like protein
MKNILGIILLSVLLATCVEMTQKEEMESDIELIQGMMTDQESAWNRTDLPAFMEPYLHSDSLMFIGSRGLNYGWQTTLDNYRKSYPDPEAMGQLRFTNLHTRLLGAEHCLVIGKWELFRDSLPDLAGHYTLIWEKTSSGWRIIADHSS